MMLTDQSHPPSPDGLRRAEQLRRLRWRARRGLLENDLLIGRFLDRQGQTLNTADTEALARLLDLPDPLLLDLLLGGLPPAGELDNPAVRDMLARLKDGSNP